MATLQYLSIKIYRNECWYLTWATSVESWATSIKSWATSIAAISSIPESAMMMVMGSTIHAHLALTSRFNYFNSYFEIDSIAKENYTLNTMQDKIPFESVALHCKPISTSPFHKLYTNRHHLRFNDARALAHAITANNTTKITAACIVGICIFHSLHKISQILITALY